MLAKEIRPSFDGYSPVAVTLFRCNRQTPHYHNNTIETILCMKGRATVYTMHEKHELAPGDIIQTDMFDIHSISSTEDNLMASFHFDLTHPLFCGKGYDLLYYMCSSDETVHDRMHHINRMRMLLLAILTCCVQNASRNGRTDLHSETYSTGAYELWHEATSEAEPNADIARLAEKVLEITRSHFQYYNYINTDETAYPPEMMERFERIMSYMLAHYAEKVTMRDICDEVHISYNYLSQFFKSSSLKTFRNFLHEIRVYHSEHLLLCHPALSVPEVGYRVGFSDPKFFYREFRRKHGHTPHQHRIWYRHYNKNASPDILIPITENMNQIRECITELYTSTVFLTEITP